MTTSEEENSELSSTETAKTAKAVEEPSSKSPEPTSEEGTSDPESPPEKEYLPPLKSLEGIHDLNLSPESERSIWSKRMFTSLGIFFMLVFVSFTYVLAKLTASFAQVTTNNIAEDQKATTDMAEAISLMHKIAGIAVPILLGVFYCAYKLFTSPPDTQIVYQAPPPE